MKPFVIAAAVADDRNLLAMQREAAFRKASKNMLLSYRAAASALEEIQAAAKEKMAIVLGSSYGELDVTSQFITTLAETGMARPFLFQSSQHNATLGFLSLQFGIKGPSITVSNRYFSGENGLDTAALILAEQLASLTLVIGVDTTVPLLEKPLKASYPGGLQLAQGAAAILLASEEGVQLAGSKPLAKLSKVSYKSQADSVLPEGPYYDSNAIEIFANAILSSRPAKEIFLSKPDHSSSRIDWEKCDRC